MNTLIDSFKKMKGIYGSLFALFILFFITACNNNTTEVLLNYTNLNGTVAKQGNFKFNFDEDLAPDSILGIWQKADYVKFEPEIQGEYKWISSKELVFSPLQNLNPATAFTATITNEVLKYSEGKKLNVYEISFQTAILNVNKISTFWTKNSNNEDQVMLTIEFSETIDVAKAEKLIEIKLDGEDIKREIVTTGMSNFLSYVLPNIKKSNDDLVLDVTLQKGLKPDNGTIAIKEPILKHALLNSPFKISINDVEVEHDGSKGIIKIICTQKVKVKNLVKFIEIKPKVIFDIVHNEDGFSITSKKFLASAKYSLKLKEGMQGDIGGKLKSTYTRDITFGKLKPEIKFAKDKAFYLSANGNRNIEATITSIGKVNVTISKVYENNLITSRSSKTWFNTSSNYYDDYYDDYYYDDYYYNSSSQEVQDVVFEKTYDASDFPRVGGNTLFKLDFTDKLKDYKGIYHIDIRSEDDRWIEDSRFVSVSDLGLIVKNGQKYMSVFINSIKTALPLVNTKIKVYGANNQLAGEGLTDSEGHTRIELINKDLSGFSPTLVTATLGSDFNVLMLRDTRVKTSDFDLAGYRNMPNGLQTFIYPERDLYRPGETVHFAGIIRSNEWEAPGKLPIKIEVRTPNGKLLKTIKKTLNKEGSFEAEFKTSKSNMTGNYIINVSSLNDVFMASKRIQVEEFMPDRIKVTTKFDKEEYAVGEQAILKINAKNLFGTPAAGRNYETEVNFKNTYMYIKGFENYNFNISKLKNNFESVLREGKTDAQGNATINLSIPTRYANMGKINATVYSTVFDETNRPVNRRDVLKISTQDAYFGIGDFDYYVGTNQQLDFPLVALDKNDKILNGTKAIVKVIKHEYRTILSKEGSYYRYESQAYEKVVLNEKITLNGKQTVSFNPSLSGRYEVRISSQEAPNAYVSNRFYAYSWGSTSNTSFEVNNEGKIDMQFDKESYEVGEEATVLFKTPFDGRLLVTIEREDVLEHFYLNTNNRAVEFSFPTTNQFIPNAYITATLFKEHKQTDFPLTVAHGFKSLKVKKSSRELNVEISSIEKSRSRTKQTINVKTAPNTKVTIAVVDEGILQVSGFKTPSPYGFFYQDRALQVNSYDIYPFLFKEISANNAGAGGDDFDLSKRVNPMQNDRVKLVSFWSGIVETDRNGKATFEVDIPQFSGSLRIMAVAHKGNAFGSAEANMFVADPIVMSSSIPRFFSPGDTAIITTTLTNTTDKKTNSKTIIECSGPIKVISASKQSVSINSKGEKQVTFKVYVQNQLGVGKIKIACNALGEEFIEETDISIRPATSLLKETGSGVITAGNKKTIDLNVANFIENSTDYKVVISKNPMVEFAEDLDYLVRYPYGCSEQTVSAVFSQVYLADITKAMYKKGDQAADVTNNINAAITKLKMRQIYNGGITMWDNGGKESWWVTAYASHFLLEVKNAGYNVDQVFIDKMLAYLKNRLKSKETVDYYYDRGKTKRIAPKEVAYSLYVLALAGKPDLSLMNYYKSKTELFTKDCEYQLSAAYALSGDKAKAREILPVSYSPLLSDKQFGGSFYSPIRDEALALNALLEIDPNNEQIGIMATHLSKKLKSTRYINTQERIFSLLALGKIAKKANESVITVNINSGGNKLANYSSGITTLYTKDIKNGKIELDVKGSGTLYYFFESEGISKDGNFKEEDSFLKVRKTFYDRNGNILTTRTFKPNDLIVIKLSIQTSYNTKVDNVVITDILPACFEIENPRTDEIPGTEWIKDQSRADFIDVRDDRINIFDDIYTYNRKPKNYYYVVRVVSKGTYRMGPVSADAMYNGEYHSYSGGDIITVK